MFGNKLAGDGQIVWIAAGWSHARQFLFLQGRRSVLFFLRYFAGAFWQECGIRIGCFARQPVIKRRRQGFRFPGLLCGRVFLLILLR